MDFASDRSFQLWAYSVSHAQLLFRSPMGNGHAKNLDVAFVGVDRIEVVTGFDGLEIVEITSPQPDLRRFQLRSQGTTLGEIDAADIRISENTLDGTETDLPNFTVHSVEPT